MSDFFFGQDTNCTVFQLFLQMIKCEFRTNDKILQMTLINQPCVQILLPLKDISSTARSELELGSEKFASPATVPDRLNQLYRESYIYFCPN